MFSEADVIQSGDHADAPIPICSASTARDNFARLPKPGTTTYTQKASKVKRPNATNRPQTAPFGGPAALMQNQLNDRRTTKAMLYANASALGLFLPTSAKKADIVKAYQTAVANSNVPGALQIPQPPALAPTVPKAPAQPPKKTGPTLTSNWTIRRKSGYANRPFTKPFDGNATTLTRYYQDALKVANPHAPNPLTLLGGQWSNNSTTNFVLIFAGQPAIDMVRKYRLILLHPFNDSFDLVPSKGFTRMIILGAPCIRNPKGNLPDSNKLIDMLRENIPFQGARILDGPTWSRAAQSDPTATTRVLSFILLDTDNTKANEIVAASAQSRTGIWLDGKRVTVKCALPSYPFKQCTRCHALSHPTEHCNRPPSFVRCGKCGLNNHTTAEHCTKCHRQHAMPACDCPPTCFNCSKSGSNPALGKGHYATSTDCPLKKHMLRLSGSPPDPTPAAQPTTTTRTSAQTARIDDNSPATH
jgi:hypothetical protein